MLWYSVLGMGERGVGGDVMVQCGGDLGMGG